MTIQEWAEAHARWKREEDAPGQDTAALLLNEAAKLLAEPAQAPFISCQCPAGKGHDCPLTSDECTAREHAFRKAAEEPQGEAPASPGSMNGTWDGRSDEQKAKDARAWQKAPATTAHRENCQAVLGRRDPACPGCEADRLAAWERDRRHEEEMTKGGPEAPASAPRRPPHDDECEAELTSHGYTQCQCEQRAEVPTSLQPTEAERTGRSISMMLGWANVPPRETLEMDIRALKARAQATSEAPASEAADLPQRPVVEHIVATHGNTEDLVAVRSWVQQIEAALVTLPIIRSARDRALGRAEQAEQENAALRANVSNAAANIAAITERSDRLDADLTRMQIECDRLRVERDRLREVLKRFGGHVGNCARLLHETSICTCGFDDALAAYQARTQETPR